MTIQIMCFKSSTSKFSTEHIDYLTAESSPKSYWNEPKKITKYLAVKQVLRKHKN